MAAVDRDELSQLETKDMSQAETTVKALLQEVEHYRDKQNAASRKRTRSENDISRFLKQIRTKRTNSSRISQEQFLADAAIKEILGEMEVIRRKPPKRACTSKQNSPPGTIMESLQEIEVIRVYKTQIAERKASAYELVDELLEGIENRRAKRVRAIEEKTAADKELENLLQNIQRIRNEGTSETIEKQLEKIVLSEESPKIQMREMKVNETSVDCIKVLFKEIELVSREHAELIGKNVVAEATPEEHLQEIQRIRSIYADDFKDVALNMKLINILFEEFELIIKKYIQAIIKQNIALEKAIPDNEILNVGPEQAVASAKKYFPERLPKMLFRGFFDIVNEDEVYGSREKPVIRKPPSYPKKKKKRKVKKTAQTVLKKVERYRKKQAFLSAREILWERVMRLYSQEIERIRIEAIQNPEVNTLCQRVTKVLREEMECVRKNQVWVNNEKIRTEHARLAVLGSMPCIRKKKPSGKRALTNSLPGEKCAASAKIKSVEENVARAYNELAIPEGITNELMQEVKGIWIEQAQAFEVNDSVDEAVSEILLEVKRIRMKHDQVLLESALTREIVKVFFHDLEYICRKIAQI